MEALIRSGAFDSLGTDPGLDRAVLMASMADAVQAAEQVASNRNSGTFDLFGDVVPVDADGGDVYASFRQVRPWTTKQRLEGEKETLGLYVTGHPFDDYERELRRFVPNRINDLKADNNSQTVAGLVVSLRTMKNKRGDNMAFVLLDDRSARIEIALFADVYSEHRDKLVKDAILIIEGQVSQDDYAGGLKMRAKTVRSLVEARQHAARSLEVSLDASDFAGDFRAEFQGLLEGSRNGRCPLVIQYQSAGARARLRLPDEWAVQPSDELLARLRERYGAERVALNY